MYSAPAPAGRVERLAIFSRKYYRKNVFVAWGGGVLCSPPGGGGLRHRISRPCYLSFPGASPALFCAGNFCFQLLITDTKPIPDIFRCFRIRAGWEIGLVEQNHVGPPGGEEHRAARKIDVVRSRCQNTHSSVLARDRARGLLRELMGLRPFPKRSFILIIFRRR